DDRRFGVAEPGVRPNAGFDDPPRARAPARAGVYGAQRSAAGPVEKGRPAGFREVPMAKAVGGAAEAQREGRAELPHEIGSPRDLIHPASEVYIPEIEKAERLVEARVADPSLQRPAEGG